MTTPSPGSRREQLGRFLMEIEAAASENPFLDHDAAEDIVNRMVRILDAWPRLTQDARARVTATVAYVVESDDEEHDLLSPIGLVDDEERVAELERDLGL